MRLLAYSMFVLLVFSTAACPSGLGMEVCGDGSDNDGDGRTDCDDADCLGLAICGRDMSTVADLLRVDLASVPDLLVSSADLAVASSGDMSVAIEEDMAAASDDMTSSAAPDMLAAADMLPAGPVLTGLTVLWSFNKAPSTMLPRWSSTNGVTATLALSGSEIEKLSGGTLTNFAPSSCLPYEPNTGVFDEGRILQWSTGGNATCTTTGVIAGATDPTIGNFNAVVGVPLSSLPASGTTNGFTYLGSLGSSSSTSPMFDNSSFFNAELSNAAATVIWDGADTRIGLKLVFSATETVSSTAVTYTLETSGGYNEALLPSTELAGATAGVFRNGTSARIPVSASVAGVVCGGTTDCFADVQLMFFTDKTMALVFQAGGANPIVAPDDQAALRGAVLLQAP